MTFTEQLLQIDGNLLIGIQHALDADWFTYVMKGVSFLANAGWFWIAICLALVVCKKTRRIGIACSLSLLLAFTMCNGVLKLLVDRARPWEVFDGVKMLIADPGDSSFPSGHATASMATAWALWLNTKRGEMEARNWPQLHKWSYVAIGLALLICLSRIYLGMHFPSDVLTGIAVGIISSTIVYIIFMKLERKNDTIDDRL